MIRKPTACGHAPCALRTSCNGASGWTFVIGRSCPEPKNANDGVKKLKPLSQAIDYQAAHFVFSGFLPFFSHLPRHSINQPKVAPVCRGLHYRFKDGNAPSSVKQLHPHWRKTVVRAGVLERYSKSHCRTMGPKPGPLISFGCASDQRPLSAKLAVTLSQDCKTDL